MKNENENEKYAESQCNMIAEALKSGRRLTALQAWLDFGCERMSARIFNLRERGMNIATERVKVPSGKWVVEYFIPGAMKQGELFVQA
ncbi:helix-turn-helix domain-containing protein [bacterium]|nr:helix-turn-helix domain-containing protein [bacterium]